MASIQKALAIVTRTMSTFAGVALVVIMIAMTANVGRRLMFDGKSILGIIEYAEIMLAALVMLSLANTQRTKDHVAVDLITRRLPVRAAGLIRGFGLLVAVGLLAWTTRASWIVGYASYQAGEYRFGIAQVPIWPARLLMPLGFLVLTVQVLVHAAADFQRALTGRSSLDAVGPEKSGVGL
jgi:TRAP-type mannitol/chloroaromatic compound transport system permease small subunit